MVVWCSCEKAFKAFSTKAQLHEVSTKAGLREIWLLSQFFLSLRRIPGGCDQPKESLFIVKNSPSIYEETLVHRVLKLTTQCTRFRNYYTKPPLKNGDSDTGAFNGSPRGHEQRRMHCHGCIGLLQRTCTNEFACGPGDNILGMLNGS